MMLGSPNTQKQARMGNALINFSGLVLVVSSLVKFLHPAKAVAYMRFLGYEHEKLFLIAGTEMLIAFLFLRRSTRAASLLLVSSYFGGAIAAHLADHPLSGTAPIIIFNANHHYLGAPAGDSGPGLCVGRRLAMLPRVASELRHAKRY